MTAFRRVSRELGSVLRISLIAGLTLTTTIPYLGHIEPAYAQVAAKFSRIDVAGNRRIESDTIRSIAGIRPGVRVEPAQINAALRNLYASGFFKLVELRPEGGRLVIDVVENPTINRISIEGNRRIGDDALLPLLNLAPRRAYNLAAAEADALRIVEAYRGAGRFAAEVRPVIIEQPDNRVDLVYEVFEGRVTEIDRISFVGNRKYSNNRLRRVIQTKESGIFSGLFSNDTFDRDRIEFDKQLLREFYLNRGFVDFSVRSAVSELSRERDGFFTTFNLIEGAQYSFGTTSVTGFDVAVDPTDYERFVRIREGATYSAREVDRVVERISDELGDSGAAFVDVVPRVTKNEGDRSIDIEFELVRTPKVFVERIDIEGNTQTLDRVIRRQFDIVEGDALNPREIRRAEERIQALGFFSSVRVSVREGSGAQSAVIDVDVEEAETGSLSFGASFSSDSGPGGTIQLSEDNFLGRGQRLSAEFTVTGDSRAFDLNFVEPALFDQDLQGGVNLYYNEFDRDTSSFQETNIGFRPHLEFPLSQDSRLRLKYRISSDEIRDTTANTSPLITEGTNITSSVGFRYTLNKLNSRTNPTRGFVASFDQDFAGLGGDSRYSRSVAKIKTFANLFDEDLVLSAELEGGALVNLNDDGPITDRFFLGGDSFRGFRFGGIGPRDNDGANVDDVLGGNLFAVARLEATFPLGLPDQYGIFGGVFFDIGSVWDLDNVIGGAGGTVDDSFKIRSSAGFSLFLESGFGPLRLNFARAIQKERLDETEFFRLTLDTRF